MSDDLTNTEYGLRGSLRGKPQEVPGRENRSGGIAGWVMAHKVQAALLVGLFALIILVQFLPPAETGLPEPADGPPVPGGRLADVTGEDELHKLKVTQAAIEREMALLRQWVSEGTGGLPEEADLARTLAMLHVRQDELDGLVRHLEAGQARLEVMAMECRLDLSVQSQRLSEQQQAFEAHLKEERN